MVSKKVKHSKKTKLLKSKIAKQGPVSIEDTRITMAGVMRCCIGTIGESFLGGTVVEGQSDSCPHCKQEFLLVKRDGVYIWLPTWQLERRPGNQKL